MSKVRGAAVSSRVLLEVCIASVDDAIAAVAGGADRLELNAALELGGLTPSLGLLLEVRQAVRVPIIAMVRPRPGGFCYSDADWAVMRRDAEALLAAGADGLTFGFLTESGEVDRDRTRQMVEACHGREAVFHRAFDVTPDPQAALDTLIDLGMARVMTSGQEPSSVEGVGQIAALVRQAAGRIEILPAGGIRPENVDELLARTGANQVHASLRGRRVDPSVRARPRIRFGSAGEAEDGYGTTDIDRVRAMRAALDCQPRVE